MEFKKGFSIPELTIVMAIMISLYLLASNNIFSPQRTNEVRTTEDTLVADITAQQTRAMTGDTSTEDESGAYGIFFEEDRYTLFKGETYTPGNEENFTIVLGPNVRFSTIAIPSGFLVFSAPGGEVDGYADGQDYVVLSDNGEGIHRTIHINRYGVIDSVN